MNISEIKKNLLKNGFRVIKIKKKTINKDLHSLLFTAFSSLIIIGFFSFLPFLNNYFSQLAFNSKLIDNTSKIDFEKTLSGKEINKKKILESDSLSLKNLFDDIFEFEDVQSDVVRLSAETIKQLFEDTKYNLNDVRKNKIVRPVSIDLLPNEIKNIESSKKRKQLFIQIVLPLILEENERIKLDRKRLFVILNKNNNSESEKKWLKKKFKQYGVVNKDLATLKIRIDEIPVSLAIAQAAKETGWGTSRFALEGNALFGQWTWNGEGIKPADADDKAKHKIMKFNVLRASVRAYQRNLNTHSSYKKFRQERAIQRDNNGKLNSLELVIFLDKYAETGEEYTKVLKKIIEQNSLQDFDDAKLLPSSEKIKKII